MPNEKTKSKTAVALPEAKKLERRAAMEEIKRLHAGDPAAAREAARLWYERNAEPVAQDDAFHRRMQEEADPERAAKAALALKANEAQLEHAQSASREAVKEWRKRNPNKVKKLNRLRQEQAKPGKQHK
jgi:hypothetical protein